MNYIHKIAAIILSLLLVLPLVSCGKQGQAPNSAGSASGGAPSGSNTSSLNGQDVQSREITVAVAPGYYPITYADDNGNAAGYDVAVFKELDERLDEYTFQYEIADKETMNVGVQTGTYQVGINSLFKTDERLEIYLMTENNVGYTPVGIIQREDSNYNSLQDLYDQQARIYATGAAGGIRFVVADWNEAHPDAPLDVELLPSVSYAESLNAVRAGESDAIIYLIPVYNLTDEEAQAGLKISDPVDVVPTFPIINTEEAELCAAIDKKLGELREDGTLSKLSVEYFGTDLFDF